MRIVWSGSILEFVPVSSFRPKTALFRNLCVNLRDFWFDVPRYASAQSLDFFAELRPTLSAWVPGILDLEKKCSFRARKLASVHRRFPVGNYLDMIETGRSRMLLLQEWFSSLERHFLHQMEYPGQEE